MQRWITFIAMILAASAPLRAQDILTWNVTSGDYGAAINWSPAQAPTSIDEVRLDNGGTATISSGDHDADKLYLGRLANNTGHLLMSGGSLTASAAAYIASAGGTTGSVTMTGSSVLVSGNMQLGSRGGATMDVGEAATVDSATLYVGSVSGSQGTLNLAGTWNATKIIFSNTGGNGHMNLDGGSLTVSGDVDMDNTTDPSRLTLNGSSGSLSARDLFGASSGSTFDFVADAGGVTTLIFRSIEIGGAILNINVDAYVGTATNLVLMDGDSLAGIFNAVNFTGSKVGTLVYDTDNGDLLLHLDSNSPYNIWANGFGLEEGPDGDDDVDGLSNVYEFGTGGSPINPADRGIAPSCGASPPDTFSFVHPVQTNLDSGLLYQLELTDDLVNGEWTHAGSAVSGTNVTGGAFNFLTNSISMLVFPQRFVRLNIELAGSETGPGNLQMVSVFADHMVLQRDTTVPVWGTGTPGAEVVVAFGGQQKTNAVDEAGNWSVELDALAVSAVSRILTVSSEGGVLEFSDVLVGEVWLCSGQSNMYRPIGGIPGVANSQVEGYEEVLALPENTTLRIFCDDGHPLWGAMTWQTARSETLELFSAVSYFFGKNIQDELDVPIGLMLVSRVGTTIQAWTPKEYALPAPVTDYYYALYETNKEEIIAWNRALDPKPDLSYELQVARTFATVGGLYNNWMAAQVPFAIRGVLWYQGESNATWEPTARHYGDMLEALATGLRAVWGRPEMPFYFVQLPTWGGATSEHWPWIRQSMLKGYLNIPNSGMAVTVDVGEASNLHPSNKKSVGERLALWAMNNTYSNACVYSGPLPSGAASETGGVRVQFDTFGSLLDVPDGTWTEVEAAGTNGVFYPATAVAGDFDALISCSQVADPVAVRYGWAPDFAPTLFNTNGLPASPFSFIREEGGDWRFYNGDDGKRVNDFY